ncbi:stress response protein NST1-like [Actinia tenebrosa]|uniref:Stress response protein NST1-like n=1 Tax=Actinia tenebrosa TaxID=6105 RepID=A0A6P8IGR1_ACTTE|nr:stress response protein NST1-like [Actinia tenebrosa]
MAAEKYKDISWKNYKSLPKEEKMEAFWYFMRKGTRPKHELEYDEKELTEEGKKAEDEKQLKRRMDLKRRLKEEKKKKEEKSKEKKIKL